MRCKNTALSTQMSASLLARHGGSPRQLFYDEIKFLRLDDNNGAVNSISIKTFVNPSMLKGCSKKMLSGSMILLTITWMLRKTLQNSWWRVEGDFQMNISPSNIFPTMLSLERISHQNYHAAFG